MATATGRMYVELESQDTVIVPSRDFIVHFWFFAVFQSQHSRGQ